MNRVRAAFLEAAGAIQPLVASPEVAHRWDADSVLPELTVRGLAGHLVRCVVTVPRYLGAGPPLGRAPIAAAAYYDLAISSADLHSADHVAIRARGEALASRGQGPLVAELESALVAARDLLAAAPEDTLMTVLDRLVIRLDDYLQTRLVEIVVHAEDLALSVGRQQPDLPPDAFDLAIGYLVSVARRRHGDAAVLRALARRERDDVDALRVL
jgi:Mycothiol maleylpyruvate isomerase N-terminal domain